MCKTEAIIELLEFSQGREGKLKKIIKLFNERFNEIDNKSEGNPELVGVCNALKIDVPSCYGNHEKAIETLIEAFPEHNDLHQVLSKVVLINTLYSTGLNTYKTTDTLSVVDMAGHIVKLAEDNNLEQLIKKGAENAVELIGNTLHNNAYSFASKYCSWHNKNAYPIMDSYAKGFIYYWCKTTNDDRTQSDINDYYIFCNLINKFRKETCIDVSVKELDSFIWMYGKAKGLAI